MNFSTSGRPEVTSIRQDKKKKSGRYCNDTATDILEILKELEFCDLNTSVRTVQRRLASFESGGRRGVKKPLISKKNRITRLKFAREYLH